MSISDLQNSVGIFSGAVCLYLTVLLTCAPLLNTTSSLCFTFLVHVFPSETVNAVVVGLQRFKALTALNHL